MAAPTLGGYGSSPGSDTSRLRVAFATGGSQESLDPHMLLLYVDQARAKACFDTHRRCCPGMTRPLPGSCTTCSTSG